MIAQKGNMMRCIITLTTGSSPDSSPHGTCRWDLLGKEADVVRGKSSHSGSPMYGGRKGTGYGEGAEDQGLARVQIGDRSQIVLGDNGLGQKLYREVCLDLAASSGSHSERGGLQVRRGRESGDGKVKNDLGQLTGVAGDRL